MITEKLEAIRLRKKTQVTSPLFMNIEAIFALPAEGQESGERASSEAMKAELRAKLTEGHLTLRQQKDLARVVEKALFEDESIDLLAWASQKETVTTR